MHPQFDPRAPSCNVLAQRPERALRAPPWAGVVFSAADAAVHCANEDGRDCVLVRWETTPDDLAGHGRPPRASSPSHGGKTSHAAVIARGMGAPCVCGAEALKIDAKAKEVVVSGTDVVLHEGDIISIDGTTGDVILGAVPLGAPRAHRRPRDHPRVGRRHPLRRFPRPQHRCPRQRRQPGRTRSFPATSAPRASASTAPSTCSWATARRSSSPSSSPSAPVPSSSALGQLPRGSGRATSYGHVRGHGRPDRYRPPARSASARVPGQPARRRRRACPRRGSWRVCIFELKARRDMLTRLDSFQEANPMLGLRGCRLGIVYPELTEMQVRAIAGAAAHLKKRGLNPKPADHGPACLHGRGAASASVSRSRTSSSPSPSRPASTSPSLLAA